MNEETRMMVLGRTAERLGLQMADLLACDDDMEKWRRAYELWRTWWDYWGGEPYYTDKYQDAVCFFCGANSRIPSSNREIRGQMESHEETCIYVDVCKLLGMEVK